MCKGEGVQKKGRDRRPGTKRGEDPLSVIEEKRRGGEFRERKNNLGGGKYREGEN